jgi:hypothetical protein
MYIKVAKEFVQAANIEDRNIMTKCFFEIIIVLPLQLYAIKPTVFNKTAMSFPLPNMVNYINTYSNKCQELYGIKYAFFAHFSSCRTD